MHRVRLTSVDLRRVHHMDRDRHALPPRIGYRPAVTRRRSPRLPLARDNTAARAREAAAARASFPTAEAKAAAWEAVVESDTLPNAMLGATIGGFAVFDQRELVRPYVDRYFAAISHLWRTRTNDTARTIVQGMFPTIQADQFVLDRAQQWLAEHPDEPPALRRLIVEGNEGVARAPRAQQRDAATR
jgi:aminopeptidase N